MRASPFACGDTLRDFPDVRCERQRWHAGDHRSSGPDDRLREWPDPPAAVTELEDDPDTWPAVTVLPAPELEETLELDYPPAYIALAWALVVAVITLWPAAAIILWRHAL